MTKKKNLPANYIAGVGLASGGAAVLAATGVGLPLAGFIAGYQIGTGLVVGVLSLFESKVAGGVSDPNYIDPVQVIPLKLVPPLELAKEPQEVSAPAGAALVGLGSFVPHMRVVKGALPRYETAITVGDKLAMQMQLDSIKVSFAAAKTSLTNVASNLGALAVGLQKHPAGEIVFDVPSVMKEFTGSLVKFGLPAMEKPFLQSFKATSLEEDALVNALINLNPDLVVESYGAKTTFAEFIDQLAVDTMGLANNLEVVAAVPA